MEKTLSGMPLHEAWLAVLLCIFIAYSQIDLYTTWNGHHYGYIGAERSVPAVNYLKYGLLKTRLGLVEYTFDDPDTGETKFKYNVRHPAGMSLLIASSFMVFGVHEWAARLVAIIVNLATIAFFYLFVMEFWDGKIALLSTTLMVLSPMFFYLRYFTGVELLTVMSTCVILYFYARWLKTGRAKHLNLTLLSFAFGTLSDWPIYVLVPVLLVHYYCFYATSRNKFDYRLTLIVPVAILMFLLYLAHVKVLTGNFAGVQDNEFDGLFERLKFRVGVMDNNAFTRDSLSKVISEFDYRVNFYYTKFSLYVILAYIIYLRDSFLLKRDYERTTLPLLMLLGFILLIMVFSNTFIIHDFYVMFLIPLLPLMAALVLNAFYGYMCARKGARGVISKMAFWIFFATSMYAYLAMSYNTSQELISINRVSHPIVEFLAQNRGDLIISSDASSYQWFPVLYYVQDRLLTKASYPEEFMELVLSPKARYTHYLLKGSDTQPIEELKTILDENFEHYQLPENEEANYTIYLLKRA